MKSILNFLKSFLKRITFFVEMNGCKTGHSICIEHQIKLTKRICLSVKVKLGIIKKIIKKKNKKKNSF
jgi:hypothetical protein